MTAGLITGLHATHVTKYSFVANWNKAANATGGYSYIVRDLNNHTLHSSGIVHSTAVAISGLSAGTLYNFGIQGLPGGKGANLHVTTTKAAVAAKPATLPPGGSVSPPTAPTGNVGYKAFALSLVIAHGWGAGAQWTAFQNVEMAEAGWQPLARNASGAFGMAQALGHGTANTAGRYGNEYGNMGTSDAICRAANNGNGYAQLIWMANYIQRQWGTPAAAWANEQRNHWY